MEETEVRHVEYICNQADCPEYLVSIQSKDNAYYASWEAAVACRKAFWHDIPDMTCFLVNRIVYKNGKESYSESFEVNFEDDFSDTAIVKCHNSQNEVDFPRSDDCD